MKHIKEALEFIGYMIVGASVGAVVFTLVSFIK
jgi:hypothetical protein